MAQDSAVSANITIGVFAPLYLDSAFHQDKYMFGKNFPRFTLQGFDFVYGVKMASDSFPINNSVIKTYVYDTKSDSIPLNELIASGKLNHLQLLIGSVKDESFLALTEFAKTRKVPFLSVTYPNDGNTTGNPYLSILSSTLRTHCESIFSYLLQNQSTANILLVRPTGSQEDRVANYFQAINQSEGKKLLSYQTMKLDSNHILIKTKLDSTRKNVIIAGSLDEEFASSLTNTLSSLRKKYDIQLIGMPNWESFAFIGKNFRANMKEFPVYYTSSYYNPRTDSTSRWLENNYYNSFKGKASDYVFKGFESFFIFSRLLQLYGADLSKNITDQSFSLFSDYNLSPVRNSSKGAVPDYYENKHVFFLKKLNGVTVKDWE